MYTLPKSCVSPSMRRQRVWLVALLAAIAGGCVAHDIQQPAKSGAGDAKRMVPTRVLRRTVWAMADRYCTTTADAYDQLESTAPTSEAGDFALERKLGASTG